MDALWEVEGGAVLPAERMPETLMPSTSGKLEDLFPGENLEGSEDASQEWLSIFLEDCLSSTTTATFALSPLAQQKPPKSAIAEAGRSKRRRLSGGAAATADLLDIASDPPPLLSQGCWLAESELIVLKEEEKPEAEEAEEAEEEAPAAEDGRQAARRCSHCLSQRTPQWRAGPLGPKTLCNACGVRFKSGRLLPEYRPAKSPTFVGYKHSNSHKKVLEMRMATPSPSS